MKYMQVLYKVTTYLSYNVIVIVIVTVIVLQL